MSELKKQTISGLIWSSLERFSTQGISFVFTVFLARLLSPSDYGLISMLSIFLAICQTFIDSGFANALIRKLDRSESDFSTAFYFNLVVAVICYLVLYFIAPVVASFYKIPALAPILRVMGISIIFSSLCIVQQAILTSKIDFKTQAQVSIVTVFISGAIGLLFAKNGYGVWALVAQSLSLSGLRAIFLWILARWKPTKGVSKKSFLYLFSYGSKMLASGLLDTIYDNIYPLVIGKFYTSAQLGNYSRAVSFAQFPSSNLTGILQRVSFPILSTIQNDDERLRVNYTKLLKLSAFIVFPLMMMLTALAEPFTLFLLTKKWVEVIPLLEVLSFSLMLYPIHAINLNVLFVKGRTDLFLRLEIVKKIIGVAILAITLPRGVYAMCWGMAISSILCLYANTYYTKQIIKISFADQLKFLLPIFANSLIMLALIRLAMSLVHGHLLQLIIGGAVGLFYYLGVNFLLKSQELAEIASLVRRKQNE